ncbi:MAG: hypothetical protein UZ13_01061 [Chloroflexi bacterium OLB13]|nr:MAG: hypothetical protein UZ13_01061 [Chloroflexi bacterium OLB13]
MDGYLILARMLKECGRNLEAVQRARKVEDALNRFRDHDRELESDGPRRTVIASIVGA